MARSNGHHCVAVSAVLVIALYGLSACAIGPSSGSHPASATPAPTATATLAPFVVYSNPMTDLGYSWSIGGACSPENDGLHLVHQGICIPQDAAPTDADIKVRIKYLHGTLLADEGYGLAVRLFSTDTSTQGYGFVINDTGQWEFFKLFGVDSRTTIVPFTANAAINQSSADPTNELEVRMQGARFTLIVNGTEVGHADDSTYTGNNFGLLGGNSDDVVCTNFLVTTL